MGGDLRFPIITIFAILITIPSSLNAIELSELPNYTEGEFKITQNYDEIINSKNLTRSNVIGIGNGHQGAAIIGSFINYSIISWSGSTKKLFMGVNSSGITNFYNYGIIDGYLETNIWSGEAGDLGYDIKNLYNYGTMGHLYSARAAVGVTNVTNYGTMGGLGANSQKTFILDNRGIIEFKLGTKYHFENINLVITNYSMIINKDADSFNSFDGQNANDNSHIVFSGTSSNVSFKDSSSKIILDFGNGFEFGAGYLFSKLVVDTSGKNALTVDFDRLIPKNDIYTLIQSGEYFIAKLTPQHSAISNISKANIHTMNNFYTMSNSMIYPRKSYHSQNLTRKNQNNLVILRERSDRRISKNNIIDSSPNAHNDNIMQDSANPLKSYESFSYRNESINRRIQRQNKRNYSRTKRNNNSVILSDSEESQKKNNRDSSPKAQNDNVRKLQNLKENQRTSQTQRFSQNLNYSQTPHDYYFILTPFFNYNSFAQTGNYNLSGFDYGFLTAFSTQVAESNHLGTHFIFSYGSLGDKKDKDLSIKSLNLNVGINYKLDLIYDMYLKARGDFYYFSNALDSLTIKSIKPNNLGFGVSVSYGKDFDFKSGGILGIEAGIDYKALKTNEVSLNSQSYKQSLLNLIYADVGVNYSKYFGGFGINLGGGFKANLAPKLAESILILNSQNLRFVLDNDKYLAYANAGISYLMQAKKFDMEFSLAYYGNYGDRVISNGGGVEVRVVF